MVAKKLTKAGSGGVIQLSDVGVHLGVGRGMLFESGLALIGPGLGGLFCTLVGVCCSQLSPVCPSAIGV